MSAPGRLTPEHLDAGAFWHLLEACTDGAYRWDAATDSVAWSPTLHATLDRGTGDGQGLEDIRELIHPDDLEAHDRSLAASKQPGNVHRVEVRLGHVSGDYRWFEVYGAWLPNGDRPPSVLVGYIRDVHERVTAEQARQQSDARFRAFFDHCPAAVYLKDADSRHLYGNARAADYAGTDPASFFARTLDELFDAETAHQLREIDRRVLETGEMQTWTGVVNTRSGERRVVYDVKFPVDDLHTGKRLVGGFGVDITEERRAQEQLQAMQRVEGIGLIAGGIAHDFNNLLTAIAGNAELARPHASPEADEAFDELSRTVQRATGLCSQLLSYAGHDVGADAPVDVGEFVRSSKALLEMSVQGRARLTLDLEGSTSVAADRSKLQQVLLNLVLNASQACPSSGGEIRVACGTAPAPDATRPGTVHSWLLPGADDLVRLSVSDNGSGMTPELIERIFEPFFTTRNEGHGLGLAAIHGIVRAMAGALAVTSTPEHGTRFDVYFPRVEATGSTEPQMTEEPAGPSEPWHGRALVVDDQPQVASIVRRLLERTGLFVTVVHTGPEALESWTRDGRFDVVVADVTMPGMGGIEVVEALRRDDPEVRVVLASGYASDRVAHLIDDRTQFLRKPFSRRELVETVAGVMRWPVAS